MFIIIRKKPGCSKPIAGNDSSISFIKEEILRKKRIFSIGEEKLEMEFKTHTPQDFDK